MEIVALNGIPVVRLSSENTEKSIARIIASGEEITVGCIRKDLAAALGRET